MEERRKWERSPVEKLLIVRNSTSGEALGQLTDITEGGLMLVSKRPVPPDSSHQCRLTLLRRLFGRDQISFTATCKWSAFNEHSGLYHTGYEITEISPDDHSALRTTLLLWKAEKRSSRKSITP